jgi:hypothetical protein
MLYDKIAKNGKPWWEFWQERIQNGKIPDYFQSHIYNSIMKDRVFQEHLVQSGETLDSIIQLYNNNIEDIDAFRKVVYKENKDVISNSYDIKAGEYIIVPSDK